MGVLRNHEIYLNILTSFSSPTDCSWSMADCCNGLSDWWEQAVSLNPSRAVSAGSSLESWDAWYGTPQGSATSERKQWNEAQHTQKLEREMHSKNKFSLADKIRCNAFCVFQWKVLYVVDKGLLHETFTLEFKEIFASDVIHQIHNPWKGGPLN